VGSGVLRLVLPVNAYGRAVRLDYAAAMAKRRHRNCMPDTEAMLAQLRSPDEQDRVTALHRVCPCAAGFLVYEVSAAR
jgi:hypothetical protein